MKCGGSCADGYILNHHSHVCKAFCYGTWRLANDGLWLDRSFSTELAPERNYWPLGFFLGSAKVVIPLDDPAGKCRILNFQMSG